MNPLIEQVALICLNSLWIGIVLCLLLQLFLSFLSEARSSLRYYVSYLTLFLILPLSVYAASFESIFPRLGIPFEMAPAITSLWFVGFTALLGKLLWDYSSVFRLRFSSSKVESGEIEECFAAAKRQSGASERVKLLASNSIGGPVMVGVIFPAIVIPVSWLSGVPFNHLRAVFAHEFAHARRFDFAANLLQRIVEAALFFNPAAHWISRIIRAERENSCDDFATSLIRSPQDYSRALIWFESFRSSSPQRPALASALGEKDELSNRIQRILRKSSNQSAKVQLQFLLTITIGILSAMSVVVLAGGTTLVTNGNRQLQLPEPGKAFDTGPGEIEVDPAPEVPCEETLKNSVQWNNQDQPLFTSIPIIKKGGLIIDIRKPEPRLFPEFPNQYLLARELPLLDATLPWRDLDHDGFNVLEEYQAGTDPKDGESHPAYSNKLKFLSRQAQTYKIKFVARPDEQRFQLQRLPSVKWPRNENFYVRIGETTEDQQIRIDGLTEKAAQTKDGIVIDASVLDITHLPSGKKYQVVRNIETVIPTYFAELRLDHGSAKAFYVKEGDEFVVPGDEVKWTLTEVKEDECTITRKSGDKQHSRTIQKGK